MKKLRDKIKKMWITVGILTIFGVYLTGCGEEKKSLDLSTPEKAMQCTMEGIKTVDMPVLNAASDNYVKTYKNWMGIINGKEYRMFNELQQGVRKKSKRYKANLAFAQKIAEDLSWEIIDIREDGSKAEIDLKISNRDMTDVIGYYMIHTLEQMIKGTGTGVSELVSNLSDIEYDRSKILDYMDQADDVLLVNVTATANKSEGIWKIHLSDPLVSACMGNFDKGEFSDEVEERLDELEESYERKMEKWGDDLIDKSSFIW